MHSSLLGGGSQHFRLPLLPAAASGSAAAPRCVEEERESVCCPMTAQDAEGGCRAEWRRQDAV